MPARLPPWGKEAFVQPDDASQEQGGQDSPGADPVKAGVVDQAQQGADRHQGEVEAVFHRGKGETEYLRDGLDDSLGGRQDIAGPDTQKYPHGGDKHGEEKERHAQPDGKLQRGNQKVVDVGQKAECKGQGDLQSVGQGDLPGQNTLNRDKNQVAQNGGRAQRDAVDLGDRVHHGAEGGHPHVIADIQHNGYGNQIQSEYVPKRLMLHGASPPFPICG